MKVCALCISAIDRIVRQEWKRMKSRRVLENERGQKQKKEFAIDSNIMKMSNTQNYSSYKNGTQSHEVKEKKQKL